MKRAHWRSLPFLVFAVLVIFFWRGLSLDPHELPLAKLGKPLPPFQLLALMEGNPAFTPALLRGHVTLLNVWASWCAACTDEQFFLMQLAREGVVIYGLNYKDNPKEARAWLGEWGNPYKSVGVDVDGKVAIDLGVYGAPETFLIDKVGIIRYRHAGILTEDIWKREFVARIQLLEKA